MDIEGFVRKRIDDYSYDDLANLLAMHIRDYKDINEDNSYEMAKAVIDEVSTTLKLKYSEKAATSCPAGRRTLPYPGFSPAFPLS